MLIVASQSSDAEPMALAKGQSKKIKEPDISDLIIKSWWAVAFVNKEIV